MRIAVLGLGAAAAPLARLGRHGAVCLRTDWNGNIRVRTDGNVFEVFPARVVAGAQEGV